MTLVSFRSLHRSLHMGPLFPVLKFLLFAETHPSVKRWYKHTDTELTGTFTSVWILSCNLTSSVDQ